MLEDVPDVETVVVGTGGGGLVSGIVTALKRRGRASSALSRSARRRSTRASPPATACRVETDTIADGLAPPFAGELPHRALPRRWVETVLVTEDEIARGDALPLRAGEARLRAGGRGGGGAVLAGKVAAGPRSSP